MVGGACSAERGGRGARWPRLWETVPCCGHLPPVRRLPQPLQVQEACFLTQFSPQSLFSCSLVMLLACQSDTAACRAVCYNKFTVPSKFSGKVLCQAAWLNWRHFHHHSLLSNKKKKEEEEEHSRKNEKRRKSCLLDLMKSTVVAMHLKNESVHCLWSQDIQALGPGWDIGLCWKEH